jgi:hypothetical protein
MYNSHATRMQAPSASDRPGNETATSLSMPSLPPLGTSGSVAAANDSRVKLEMGPFPTGASAAYPPATVTVAVTLPPESAARPGARAPHSAGRVGLRVPPRHGAPGGNPWSRCLRLGGRGHRDRARPAGRSWPRSQQWRQLPASESHGDSAAARATQAQWQREWPGPPRFSLTLH